MKNKKLEKSEEVYSANTLFHFTNSFDNIQDILINGFHPYFCLEDFSIIVEREKNCDIHVPMVSFCDLPLNKIKKHLMNYGRYGIGLKKEWGLKNGVSPVFYIYKNSNTSKVMIELNKYIYGKFSTRRMLKEARRAIEDLSYFHSYIKPYEGYWERRNFEWVRYYDEREWRFVPFPDDFEQVTAERYIEFQEFEGSKAKSNMRLNNISLNFTPDDIKYIIVKDEDEILDAYNKVLNIKSEVYPYNKAKILSTRIISSENILEDF